MAHEISIEAGLDFQITEEMNMLRQTAREFAETEIRPHVMKYDEAQEFPMPIIKKMAELGFLGATVPQELEGSGLTALEFIMIMEEIARVDPSVALTLAAHSGLCLEHLLMWGNEEQKKRYVPDLATGRAIGSWCLTEPFSGSDAGGMRTEAVLDGNSYVLNGSKTFITNGSFAATFVVIAKSQKSEGKKGISAFIVERGMKGVSVGKKENKLGMRASDTVQVLFDNVRVPKENLIGREGEGFKQALGVLDSGRIGIAALSVGLAQGAFEAAVKFSKERQAFGKPISEFQGIQFKLADMATEIQAARLLAMRAAWTKAQGRPINLVAAQAKYFASEVAQRAATEAVQIHGGYGFIKEFPVEKFYRDVKLLTIGEGTSEVQRMVIARNILS
ncbi:MAG TPA: acyl-CoA dehydrogenase family protein [Bacteroidota bacterium]|nr:acyl-CoA dehydrogenase family protein [Bacteroidota bacterium]